MTLCKDFLNLFQGTTCRLWEHEYDMYACNQVEYAKDKVRVETNVGQAGRDGKGQSRVERPVGSRGDRDSLGADFHGEDFRGVGPGGGPDGNSEAAHEEVREDDDSAGDAAVVDDDPDS